jgi:4,5-dihydroxyphthalate decarboxylase
MPLTLRLALRDWDYMTPLVLGDVQSPRLDVIDPAWVILKSIVSRSSLAG